MSEKFSLKWNDFESNVSRTFGLLRKEKEFFDVTLVSEDHHQVEAHKLVLSACSPFFKNLLTRNQHSHPLLCLDGIRADELQFVLDYIYQGEVQVHQDQLDRFLLVARKLQLDGLSQEEHGYLMEQLNNKTGEQEQEQEQENIPQTGDILMEKWDGLNEEHRRLTEQLNTNGDSQKFDNAMRINTH